MRATNDLEMVVPDPEWLGQVLNDIDHYERVVEVPQIDSSKTPAKKVRSIATIESADGSRRLGVI